MTYRRYIGNDSITLSDTLFKDMCKKPTISLYDAKTNCEQKIASFNNQETFETFIKYLKEKGICE